MKGSSSDVLHQAIDRRFADDQSVKTEAVSINNDFYMDVLSVFHAPERFNPADFQKYPIEIILDYLRRTHHFYVTKNLPELEFAAATLAKREPRLAPMQELILNFFTEFREKLEKHISEEEARLFPYLDTLCESRVTGKLPNDDSAKQQLMGFLVHHDDDLEDQLQEFVRKLDLITEETKDSFSLKMMITRLTFFELDLRIHGRLEDEVLMPLAIEMEKELLK